MICCQVLSARADKARRWADVAFGQRAKTHIEQSSPQFLCEPTLIALVTTSQKGQKLSF